MFCKLGKYSIHLHRSYPESAWLLGVHYQKYFNAGSNYKPMLQGVKTGKNDMLLPNITVSLLLKQQSL